MPTRLFLAVLLSLSLLVPPVGHAAAKPRPFAGIGILLIRPASPTDTVAPGTITLYREPGVGRLAELPPAKLPTLSQVLKAAPGETAVAVQGKRGAWLRIAYDEAGREGWVQLQRHWQYDDWDTFLKGRVVRLFAGMKKNLYSLRKEPATTSPEVQTLSASRNLRVIQVQEDWALAMIDLAAAGWIRWRDGDGRFLVVIDETFDPQKR
ncbi:hypothetical protein [Geomobilimonas luticola]|uniref:SH3 domain-containing protein n=1 Tax=Geomobilimonas luticola TaxID=1114878 RepID=A0ABS5SA34_9BACT|nr:hypothetical protein [Geomobilimonas luticola]MBT0652240.1 hypothetical protein [Geomobilimonas luticola]